MKNWSVTAASGGRYPGVDPVFFSDNGRVALATALAIKIFQLSTKQMSAKISIDCTDTMQLVLGKTEEEFFLLKRSGHIESIGLQDSEPRRWEIDNSLRVKKLIYQTGELRFVAIVANAKGCFDVGELTLSDGSFQSWLNADDPITTNADAGIFAVSPSVNHIAFITPKSGRVEVVKIINGRIMRPFQPAYPPKAIRSVPSTLAVSDTGLVAVGNTSGVIDIFYNEGAMRTLKWHLEPVLSLRFTLNDEYLISGGSERVLVYWQMATNKQQFLPRLDGAISSICSNHDNTLYGLTLADSQLVILSAVDLVSRLHVAGTKAQFSKLPPDHQVARRRRRRRGLDLWTQADYTTPLAIQPGSRNAYLLAGSSQAQAYSLARDDQELVISLSKTLETGKVRSELNIADPVVEILGFTTNGETMITVDSAQTPPGLMSSADIEVSLKFWQFNESQLQPWSLSTRVVNPHGPQVEIRDYASNADSIVTAGNDGSLRLWKRATDGSWAMRRVLPGFSMKTRHVAVALSRDNSVLAVAHETSVYLINLAKFEVIKQLPNLSGSPVRALTFAGQCLVVLAKSRLVVVDLVTLVPRWAIELKMPTNGGRLLASEPAGGNFALAVNHWTTQYRVHSQVLLFNPLKGPVPLESYAHPFAIGSLTHIPGTVSFCFIDQRGVLCTLAGPSVASNVQEQSQELLRSSLVSLKETNKAADEEEMDVDMDGASKSLDVNSVMNIFDNHAELDQLFDKVLTLVS